jgi:hypothetical protein
MTRAASGLLFWGNLGQQNSPYLEKYMPLETEMQERSKDETVPQETLVAGTAWIPIVVGCAAAFLLHATVWYAMRMAAGIYERLYDRPHVFSTNPTWTVLWGVPTLALWWRYKPSLIAWGAPFTLCVAFWWRSGIRIRLRNKRSPIGS